MDDSLRGAVDAEAKHVNFTGVVRVDRAGELVFAEAYGLADRAHALPTTVDTRFGIASGTKGLTALAVVGLIADGQLSLDSTARSVLGSDLPLIDDRVTVEQLLAHRSGIGDYFDEDLIEDVTDYVMSVPAQELAETEQFLPALDGHPMVFAPGERFAYNNGGYVVLALIAERIATIPYHDLVEQRVCAPAGMIRTAFLRSDELPGDAALGYVHADGLRTNLFHLPVRGNGDGGIYTSAEDVCRFWDALFQGRIVPEPWVAEMLRPRTEKAGEDDRPYGLGFWLASNGDAVELHGYDVGASFRTVHDLTSQTTHTIMSNTFEGTWPIETLVDEHLGT